MKTLGAIFFLLTLISLAQNPNAKLVNPLKTSDSIPDGILKTKQNTETTLKGVCKENVSLIIFYRGGWCPFCNLHLADLQNILGYLKKNNVKILAISSESPSELVKTTEKNELGYELYQDEGLALAKKFGVAYQENSNWTLPVPSVFIADKNGIIQFAHWNPNYKERLEATEIKTALKKIIPKTK